MRRRGASSGKAAKQGRRESGKSRAARKPAPRLAELEKRLSEALRQRAATSEVLEIISSSERELKPVFQAILKNAVRLCEAKFGNLLLIDGQTARWAAGVGTPPKLARYLQSPSYRPTPGSHLDRVMRTGQVSYSADDTTEPVVGASARLGGAKSSVCVPMIKDKTLVGAIFMYRTEVRPFTDDQINLVKSFAAQAVIALQNARLFNETKEALERQTATAEVLQVINSSPGDLAPVFDAILMKAHSLCGVTHGALQLYIGAKLRAVAVHGLSEAFADRLRQGFVPGSNHPSQPLLKGARFVQIRDQGEIDDPLSRAAFELAGIHTVLFIPLRKDGILLGLISAACQEVKPFTEKEIGLLESFAAQAVIAIENARLLNETKESLERQTATADVLKVIASSPADVQPVFNAIAERSNRLIDGVATAAYSLVGDMVHLMAFTPVNAAADAALRAMFPAPISQFVWAEPIGKGETYVVTDAAVGFAGRP